MGPTTNMCRALAVLVCLTILAVPGRVKAQPADAGAGTNKAADLARKLEEARRQAERARDEAEAIRREVGQERDKAVQAAREAAAQRDAAQLAEAKARQQAEGALAEHAATLQAAEQALQKARGAAVRATKLQALQDAFARKKEQLPRDGQDDVEKDLERAKRVLQRRFDMQREELTNQLKHLEMEQQRMLADLQIKAEIMRERAQRQGERGGSSSSGKLDQILERLQRIEMRLDRLERSRPGRVPATGQVV